VEEDNEMRDEKEEIQRNAECLYVKLSYAILVTGRGGL
jgi:hypothetical protein